MALHHRPATHCHGDRKHGGERGWNHRNTRGHRVDDHFVVRPVVGGEHNNCEKHCNEEENNGQLREADLQRRTHGQPKERSDLVPDGKDTSLHIAVGSGLAVRIALHRTDLLALGSVVERLGDFANLGAHTGSGHHARSTALCHGRRRKRHVEPVADTDVLTLGLLRREEHAPRVLGHGNGLTGQESLVRLKVDRLDKAAVGRHRLADTELDNVTGDDLAGSHCSGGARANHLGGRRGKRAERVHCLLR